MTQEIKSLKWFRGKKVLIMGLGQHNGGVGTAKFLSQLGAEITITDLKTKKELKESINQLKEFPIKEYILGRHRQKDFIETDLIIKNPAVPPNSFYLALAEKHQVPIETEISLFFKLCSGKIIGITGTKGKSTTASLIFHLLSQKYPQVMLAGNIGQSALEKLPQINSKTLVVLELSSFQLNSLKKTQLSPHLAVITNFSPDHLDYYSSIEDYFQDKKNIFRFQKTNDYLILNYNDPRVRKLSQEAPSQVYFYGFLKPRKGINLGAFIQKNSIFYKQKYELIKTKNLTFPFNQKQYLNNLLAALTVAQFFQISPSQIKKALQTFSGLEGRLELVGEIKGVKYVNDTYATNPSATIAALKSFPSKKIILIAGGNDKNLNFIQLGKIITQKVKGVILLEGNATDKLAQAIKKASGQNQLIFGRVKNMKEALKLAQTKVQKNDIVLLSPACSSFGLFKDALERGRTFKLELDKLSVKI